MSKMRRTNALAARRQRPTSEGEGWRRHKPDYGIVVLAGILMLIGMIVIFSLGPALQQSSGITVSRQFVAIIISVAAFTATAHIPFTAWVRLQKPLIGLAAISSLLLLMPGGLINPSIKGATRWIVLGPISFQPAEILKLAMVVYLAYFLTQRIRQGTLNVRDKTLVPLGILLGVVGLFVVILQRDLGTMLAIVTIFLTMLFVSGLQLKQLAMVGVGLVSAGVMAVLVAPHRIARIATFLDPTADAQGAGYHINQALIAVGSGGLFGLGLGKSVQAYGYLPEAGSDSIFAIYAEKFGFVGSVLILILFAALLIRIIRVIENAPDTYTRLLAAGVFAWIFGHIMINVGAMLSLLPLTGITLPFLSSGGTSLIFIMAALGIVFNISRYTRLRASSEGRRNHADSYDGRRYGRSRLAHTSRSF